MSNQNIVEQEDGYGPSENEDNDYYEKFASTKMTVLKNFKTKTNKWRKRKRGTIKVDGYENLADPLVVFGWDIMLMILNHLDALSVAQSLVVSRTWHGVASSDAIWSKKVLQPHINQQTCFV